MKKLRTLIVLMMIILPAWVIQAQSSQGDELVVPLSNPGKAGLLKASLHTGNIKVVGYSGSEVIITVTTNEKEISRVTRNGLTRIPNSSFGITAREENNYVTVSSSNMNKEVNLHIQVPRKFSLKLRSHNGDWIVAENVEGEVDVSFHNGDIRLDNIAGSAVCSSHNGDITVVFTSITPDAPMAFTTYNGDVDITFPGTLKANLKMRSDRGEILTGFDVDLQKNQPKREGSRESGVYKVSIEAWVTGKVNGGGPEMLFKSYNGDILIRKK